MLKVIEYRGEDKQWLESHISKKPHPDKKKILEYLKNGTRLAHVKYTERDILGSGKPLPCCRDAITDGVWVWKASVVYWIKKYNLMLPDEFIQYMKDQNWTVPSSLDLNGPSKDFMKGNVIFFSCRE